MYLLYISYWYRGLIENYDYWPLWKFISIIRKKPIWRIHVATEVNAQNTYHVHGESHNISHALIKSSYTPCRLCISYDYICLSTFQFEGHFSIHLQISGSTFENLTWPLKIWPTVIMIWEFVSKHRCSAEKEIPINWSAELKRVFSCLVLQHTETRTFMLLIL